MGKRKPVVIQVEFTLEEWAQEELEGRRGKDDGDWPLRGYWEVCDAVETRFGGSLQPKWLNDDGGNAYQARIDELEKALDDLAGAYRMDKDDGVYREAVRVLFKGPPLPPGYEWSGVASIVHHSGEINAAIHGDTRDDALESAWQRWETESGIKRDEWAQMMKREQVVSHLREVAKKYRDDMALHGVQSWKQHAAEALETEAQRIESDELEV